jgi:hypothetical protein
MANEFYVKKNGDKILLTIISKSETSIELDIEDAADLALDIQQYIQQYIDNTNINNLKKEAKEQNDKKNNFSVALNEWIDSHFPNDTHPSQSVEEKYTKIFKLNNL